MSIPEKFLLSDLLKYRVRCNEGIDHGPGLTIWMHPPVHRVLGWVSKPSAIKLERAVWRLDQLRGFSEKQVFVKGRPSLSDQITLERLPTLIDADLLDIDGQKLGQIADVNFVTKTGEILQYLISRSDPRLPGTSRWSLGLDRIVDQQPGYVKTSLSTIDDLPLIRSSIRQDILRRSKFFRDQFSQLTDKAGDRLEGWLEEPPWDDFISRTWETREKITRKASTRYQSSSDHWPHEDEEEYFSEFPDQITDNQEHQNLSELIDNEEDPWV